MLTAEIAEDLDQASLRRLGILMKPESGNKDEVGGVLNPGACRDRQGHLLLYPRIVGEGNYSRIGVVEVISDKYGVPVGVDRLGYALEPELPYEKRPSIDGVACGGVEDPRVVYLAVLDLYVMSYVAFGPNGPRNALAISEDAHIWHRLGLVEYDTDILSGCADLNFVDNKDAVFFDRPVVDSDGALSIAVLHRPTFAPDTSGVPERPSIWISYMSIQAVWRDQRNLLKWTGHKLVAEPQEDWESLKIGAGAAPFLARGDWHLMYHGVSGTLVPGVEQQQDVCYCPGAMLLDRKDPSMVKARSRNPLLRPTLKEECEGIVPNVIFPSATDRNLVFYGMCDTFVGVGELTL